MNINDVLTLMDKMKVTDIHELKITDKDFKLHLSKGAAPVAYAENTVLESKKVEQGNATEMTINEEKIVIDANDVVVKSPLVGIFYEASSPEAEPFVSLGQKVKKGDVLCTIEAMKIYNEIKSPVNGVIKNILPSNLEVIEYDQELFVIGEE